MAELVKPWNDGGSLSVTYNGDGDGSAVFSSDSYEGIDRVQSVVFRDIAESVAIERTVRQEGIRQPIGLAGGGIFRLANGGRFGVLKEEPSAPLYEEIEYVTFDGTKVFDTNIKGNNKTTLEFKFKRTNVTSPTYLLGYGASTTSDLNVYLNSNGKWRYGNYAPVVNTRNYNEFVAEMAPTRYTVNGEVSTFSNYNFTTAGTIAVGGSKTSTGSYGSALYRGYIYYFRMTIAGVLVADWIPVRRLSDGLECFWDTVTKSFIEPIIQ